MRVVKTATHVVLVILAFACSYACPVVACDAGNTTGTAPADGPLPQAAKPSVFLASMPKELPTQANTRLSELAKTFPVSQENASRLRQHITQMNTRYSKMNEEAQKEIRRLDGEAIPAISELLSSQDDETRLKAVIALQYLVRPKESVSTYRGNTEQALTAVFRRSLFDRSSEVRLRAVVGLYLLGFGRYRKTPDEIDQALRAAEENDPDADIRKEARKAREKLGLAPATSDSKIWD